MPNRCFLQPIWYVFCKSEVSTSGEPNLLTFLLQIGPILPLELKPVPERILEWIAEDDKDIVYMCMGTVATISDEMAAQFVSVFGFGFQLVISTHAA
jgi:UDP:flavonoid glycosyltransferase YjiC (YdhE family)